MKKAVLLFIGALCMVLATGCGPSLKEYVGASQHYATKTVANGNVTVNIEGGNTMSAGRGVFGAIGAAVNVATSVGATVINNEQRPRLQKIINPATIGSLVNSGFENGFSGSTHLTVVPEGQNPDLRILLTVEDYGIWSEDLLSPVKFFVEADIRIVHTQSMETIYRNGVSITQEVSNLFSEIANSSNVSVSVNVSGSVPRTRAAHTTMRAIGDVGRVVGGAANLTAFFELTDEEISVMFDYMAYEAGLLIADRLNASIYR